MGLEAIGAGMRVDVFLKMSRLVKRRSIAKELCEDGAVALNGRVARAGKELSEGDVLALSLWNRFMELEVVQTPDKPVPARDSRDLYRVIRDERKQAGWQFDE